MRVIEADMREFQSELRDPAIDVRESKPVSRDWAVGMHDFWLGVRDWMMLNEEEIIFI